jgi:hypothetical protein
VVSATNSFGESANSAEVSATPAASSNSATFVKTDTTTQGSWKGVYGSDGYSVIGDVTRYPGYATVGVSGNSYWSWADTTSDGRALQKVNSNTDRIAACYYTYSNMTYDLNLTDALVHQVAFYSVDFDTQGRTGKIEIFDASSNALLDTQSLSSYSGGKYLVWNIKGHVLVKLSFVSASGAPTVVVSGVFFK